MSGGYFDYKQYLIQELGYELEQMVNSSRLENYSKETIDAFMETIKTLYMAATMLRRVDYLLSGDDGEDDFTKKWKEEVEKTIEKLKGE